MASTESATDLSSVLDSLSETLVEFRAESAEIEAEFFDLFEGFAERGPRTASAGVFTTTTAGAETIELEAIAVERLETLDRSISEQREEFVGRQERLSEDVGQLRELVDRQTQLFSAWIDSTAQPENSNATRKRKR